MVEELKNLVQQYEKAAAESKKQTFVLKLYVSGMTINSMRAIENIKRFCLEHLEGRYELEVIDVYQKPDLIRKEQILAAPTLVKELPPPLRRFIGDLSEEERILIGLNLVPKDGAAGEA